MTTVAAVATEVLAPRWAGATVVVAAPGPSLTAEVAGRCRGWGAIAVQDAWRLLPWADVLYGCDARWWNAHGGCPGFAGEKWSSHDSGNNDKRAAAQAFGLRLVAGRAGDGFSLDPAVIHYGAHSGFQAVNLALLFGATRIVLVGFDLRVVGGRRHFFGDHPPPLRNTASYETFIRHHEAAAAMLPPGVTVVNATPASALRCWPSMPLEHALQPRVPEVA